MRGKISKGIGVNKFHLLILCISIFPWTNKARGIGGTQYRQLMRQQVLAHKQNASQRIKDVIQILGTVQSRPDYNIENK